MWALGLLVGLASSAVAETQDNAAQAQTLRFYVGTYTGGKSEGIYLFDFDSSTGALKSRGVAAKSTNPSFLAMHPSGKHLYAVNEVNDYGTEKTGAVTSFAVHLLSGILTELNQQSTGGDGPCYVTVDRGGRNVLVANYGGGSVAVLPLESDGRLKPASAFIQHRGSGANRSRQAGPHAHSINLDRANRFAVAADLGLDKLLVYRFDPVGGTLAPNDPPATPVAPGSGPRHFAFHPDGRHAYVINEIALTVTAFDYDASRGVLTTIQTIPTVPPGDHKGFSTAEVQVHPSGKFLYGSNRGHNSIAMFSIDQASGKLTSLGQESTQGKTPRNFAIDPTGKFLLAENQDSDTIVVFRIDGQTGRLQPTGHKADVPKPVCIKFWNYAP